MALYTQDALANSLKKLSSKKSLDKITVNDLVEDCGMNRNTFYYRFHGIPELLQWMLEHDLTAAVGGNISLDSWQKGVSGALQYIYDNAPFFKKLYHSRYWKETREFLNTMLSRRVAAFTNEAIAKTEAERGEKLHLSEFGYRYIVRFYCAMLYSAVEEWFLSGMHEPADKLPYLIGSFTHNMMYRAFDKFSEDTSKY